MADESMVRTLAAQARAIWPQEAPLLLRYRLPSEPAILDAGCGTGEGASRLAELFGSARVLGVDIIDAHLDLARSRYARHAPRLSFSHQSIYALAAADEAFDLVACRHVLHSIPHTDRVLAELVRVTRHGGYLHVIAEDYGMPDARITVYSELATSCDIANSVPISAATGKSSYSRDGRFSVTNSNARLIV